jgi:hypothetical protein
MNILQYLAKATEDGNGNVSTMRIVVLYGCLLFLTMIAAVWITAMLKPDRYNVALAASAAFAATLTVLLGMKLGQNATENAGNKTPPTTTP